MEKEFVSYEQAVAVIKLGFCEPTIRGWDENGKIWYHPDSDVVVDNPTKSQVFRWFREKYELFVDVYPLAITASDKTGYRYSYLTYNLNGSSESDLEIIGHYSYEEAENACIDKLIELAKQQGDD